jgi:hypothetical protein
MISFFIEESYKLLLNEKENYYGDNSFPKIEEEKLNKIIKRKFLFENFYYSLDGHNFFQRKDRYKRKIFLLIYFGYLSLYNLFEIIENMVRLAEKQNSSMYLNPRRIGTLIPNMLNILVILCLTTYTVVKRKIHTVVYY